MLTDKAPYLVTIVLAIIGWAVTHIVDRVTTAPTIEYSIVSSKQNGSNEMRVALQNITTNTAFRGLKLILGCEAKNCTIKSLVIQPTPPAYEGQSAPNVTAAANSGADFTFDEIQPNSHFQAIVIYTGDSMPTMRITDPAGVANIVLPSVETWIAKNEFFALSSLLLAAIFVLTILMCIAARQKIDPPKSPLELVANWLVNRG